ncbi:RNA polymerase-associated protein LEO1 [Frankliniella fusca]|uniref:RNA polymerase-associated protein LEO1 n=1 Tax=Frankliniella fusca TaxID=407009 RepID=A0AAE1H5Y3_9NEOP|nr:RNA polymerase-associated protein LEO1 [Frankliniella fusca]
MKIVLVCFAVALALAEALPVRVKRGHVELEEHGHGHGHYGHATSYQNFNLESYHPVPVYKKHEPLHHVSHDEHADLGGHGHLSAALSLHEDQGHELGHEAYGGGEASYHRAALTDGADHGDDAYSHAGAAAVSEDADEGYEGHGGY